MVQPLTSSLSGPTIMPPAISGNLNGVLLNSPSNPLTAMSLTNAMASLTAGLGTPASPVPVNAGAGNIAAGVPSAAKALSVPNTSLATPTTTGGTVPSATPTAATTGVSTVAATPAPTPQATPAAAPAAANNAEMQNLTDLIKLVSTTLVMVLQQMTKGTGAAGTAGAAAPAPAAAAPATVAKTGTGLAAAPAGVSAALDQLIVGGTAAQKAQLKQNLLLIAQDADGAKLVNESIRRGVTFNVGDPAKAGGANDVQSVVNCPTCAAAAADASAFAKDGAGGAGGAGTSGNVVINGVTVTKTNGRSDITVANPNKLDTIVHEMIHATTTGDGNSQTEEATAKFIGARVANNVAPGSAPNQDFNTVLQNTIPLYQGLQRSNNIAQSLAGIGITA